MTITVDCPICGKKDISSHTEKCPDCGFEIQKYFIASYGQTGETPDIKIPKKPKLTIGDIIVHITGFGLMILFIYFLPNLIAIILLLLDLLIMYTIISTEIDIRHRFNLAQKDFDAYLRLLEDDKRKQDKLAQKASEHSIAIERERQKELAKLPTCPICGSKNNVKRISTFNRSVSVAVVGLASSKIGKQYECTHCKHKW